MSQMNSFESKVFRLLVEKIEQIRQVNSDALAAGNAKAGQSDIGVTVHNYCEAVGYIRALNNVVDWCAEIEDGILGRTRKS